MAPRGLCRGLLDRWCAESIARPRQENYRDPLWMIPFALTALTFAFVHAVQRSASARLERIGFIAVMTASALVFLGNVGLVTDQPSLSVFAFPWGAVLWTVGLMMFGMGTWQAKVLPGYMGWRWPCSSRVPSWSAWRSHRSCRCRIGRLQRGYREGPGARVHRLRTASPQPAFETTATARGAVAGGEDRPKRLPRRIRQQDPVFCFTAAVRLPLPCSALPCARNML